MRTTAIAHSTFIGIHTPMSIDGQPGSRQSIAGTSVATEQVDADVLTQSVTISQQTFVDVLSVEFVGD